MRKIIFSILTVCTVFVFYGCRTSNPDTITQVSTIDALLLGAYDGIIPCGELTGYGNFGIGTFDKLAGEMVVLDDKVYQIKADAKVYQPGPKMTTPFAVVCDFEADSSFALPEHSNFESLKKTIDKTVPNQNIFCAIKIRGTFKKVKARSVPGQNKPYPPLKEVVKTQAVFYMENVKGTIVAFRCPPFVKGINMPGYHLHFISDDRTQGGHVLEFDVVKASCELDLLNRFYMILPDNGKGLEKLNLNQDLSKDLEKVER